MLGFDSFRGHLRGNWLDAFAFDRQEQPSAVIMQGLGAIRMIARLCQRRDVLVKPLLPMGCDV